MYPHTILSISFSSRFLGVSVFKDGFLCDYHNTFFKQKWSRKKKQVILKKIKMSLLNYDSNLIVLVTQPPYYQTKKYQQLEKHISSACIKRQIPVVFYTLDPLLSLFKSKHKAKKKFMNILIETFPELEYLYQKESRNKSKYYYKMFDAIGMGWFVTKDLL